MALIALKRSHIIAAAAMTALVAACATSSGQAAPPIAGPAPVPAPETGPITLGAVSMGNPHAVLRVEDVDTAPVAEWGPVIERCEAFPRKVNVGFMQIVNEHHIRLRVFERGTGETLACGTGACAAVVSGQLRGWLKPGVTVSLPGGDLRIDWDGQGPVKMTGPATTVYEGRVNIERK